MQTYSFRNTLSNDSNRLNLLEFHDLQGGAVDTSRRGKVDNSIDVGVLGHGFGHVLVDRQQSLAGSPVHLAHELTTEGVDDTGNGGGLALADEVEIEHALNSSWLETVHEASCLVVKKGMFSTRA